MAALVTWQMELMLVGMFGGTDVADASKHAAKVRYVDTVAMMSWLSPSDFGKLSM